MGRHDINIEGSLNYEVMFFKEDNILWHMGNNVSGNRQES